MRALITALVALAGLPQAHAALEQRDINLDGVVDAYYDTSTDTSWLAQVFESNQPGAVEWAGSLEAFGFDDWHLPRFVQTGPCSGLLGAYSCEIATLDPNAPGEAPFGGTGYWRDGRADYFMAHGPLCLWGGTFTEQCGVRRDRSGLCDALRRRGAGCGQPRRRRHRDPRTVDLCPDAVRIGAAGVARPTFKGCPAPRRVTESAPLRHPPRTPAMLAKLAATFSAWLTWAFGPESLDDGLTDEQRKNVIEQGDRCW
jgi:hypothetical protein